MSKTLSQRAGRLAHLARKLLLPTLLTAALLAASTCPYPASAQANTAARPADSPGTGIGAAAASPSAVIALLPNEPAPAPGQHVRSVLDRIADQPAFALGMASATQAVYDPVQSLIDVSQGARVQMDLLRPQIVPGLSLSGTALAGWPAVAHRAATAPATLKPGLLAASVPGGAAFVGIANGPYAGVANGPAYTQFKPWRYPDAALAADLGGRVSSVSLGAPSTVAARAQSAHRALTVVELPPGMAGEAQLAALLATRARGELLLAMQLPPEGYGPQTLWLGIAGLRAKQGGMLSSQTTHVSGYVSATDIAPTILRHLGTPVPNRMNGQAITVRGHTDKGALVRFRRRIAVTDERKIPALKVFLLSWGVLILLFGLLGGDRTGARTGLRVGGPAVLWLPSLSMLTAALEPSNTAELAILAVGALTLGVLCDRLIPWPHAPLVPAWVALFVYALDLSRGSALLDRSLLGPSPLVGVRFYGVGNDLEIAITLLLLAAFAAGVRQRTRASGSAYALVAGGIALALIVCPGRAGADVGGIFTIAAGVGVGSLMLLPALTKRAISLAVLAPLLGLAVLALVDVASGAGSHFLRSILHAKGGDDIGHLLQRRYEVAWHTLSSGFQPLFTAISLLAGAYAYRFRRRLYAAVDEPWRAFLGGGFAAALACMIFNDSGPLPLIQGIGVLGLLTAYLRCPPASSSTHQQTDSPGSP